MARDQPSKESKGRGGLVALLLAWLLVLGLSAAAAGYFYLYPESPGPRSSEPLALAIPPPDESGAPEPEIAAAEPETLEQDVAAATPAESQATPAAVADGPPRIAVVVTGLGLSAEPTETAIERLPGQIALSFSPYAPGLDTWFQRARDKGHEVMLDLPMEPVNFPVDDPGPRALLIRLPAEQNLVRLKWILERGRDYVGVTAHMGSRFLDSTEALYPILAELKARGILFLDNGASADSVAARLAAELILPHAVTARALDDSAPNREAISARLVQIERLALTNGTAVALGRPYPATLERLAEWTASLDARGFVLVPITALAGTAQTD